MTTTTDPRNVPDLDATLDADALLDSDCPDDPFTLTPDEEDEEAYPDFPLETRYEGGFSIMDEASAGWYVDKILSRQERIARIKAQAQEMIEREEADLARLHARFGAELEQWALREIESRGGKTKTLRLLQGTVSVRTVPASVRIADAEAAMEAAKAQMPELVQVVQTEKLDTAAYRKAAQERLEATGDVLPGVEPVPARQSVTVKAEKGGKAS